MTQEWCVEVLILTFGYTGILSLTHEIVTELWNWIISAKNPINSHIFRKFDDKSQLKAFLLQTGANVGLKRSKVSSNVFISSDMNGCGSHLSLASERATPFISKFSPEFESFKIWTSRNL